ncbi:PQQ-dependent catabolism-associated CXXCW motif protein [Sinorhizobium meliloti]|uniref:PQQ-dependent catabolism-associated CXXCW motif protein n=1 Tax=Rhizobium meliloti TaxID=382 RepID=UPI00398CA0FA
MTRQWLHSLVLLLFAAFPAAAAEEPAGYRESEYRAEVPATLSGATVVSTEAAHALWKTGQVAFIDVLPQPPKPANLPEGTVWNEKPRLSIPSALWLPNVGYGRLADVMHAYFRAGLEKATDGDKSRPVLFFCLDGCWMSWNAGKRALEYGYTHVFWYPQGTDGWTAAGYPTERIEPEPGGR